MRNLLADQEKLMEQIYGPTRRFMEDLERQQRDLQRYFDSAAVDLRGADLILDTATALSGSLTGRNELPSLTLSSLPADESLKILTASLTSAGTFTPLPELTRMTLEAGALTRDLELPYLEEMRRGFDELAAQTKILHGLPPESALKLIDAQISGVAAVEKVAAWALPDAIRLADTSLLDAVLLPISTRTRFIEETITQFLGSETNSAVSVALTAALRQSAVQRDAYADAITRYPRPPGNAGDETEKDFVFDPNQPDQGRAELLIRARDANASRARLSAPSNAHRAAMLSTVLVNLVVDVNTAAKLSGKDEVFSPTSRGYRAIPVLNTTIARDSVTLGRIVNALYFLIYESAGANTLRFLADGGGPLKNEECEPIWWLKRLRNSEDHDLDHGPKRDRAGKWHSLARDLRSMGFERIPQTPIEFERLQIRLYEGIVSVLRLALSRFELPPA